MNRDKYRHTMKIHEITNQYKTGMCDIFALALHDISGLPLGGWAGVYYDDFMDEEALEFCHICVVLSFENEKWADVDGIHTGEPTDCLFNNPVSHTKLVPLSKEEASEVFTMCEIDQREIDKAKQYIQKNPNLRALIDK